MRPTQPQVMRSYAWATVLLVWLVFAAGLQLAATRSFSPQEAWSAWAIRDEIREANDTREWVRNRRDSLLLAVERAQERYPRPLYAVALDGWAWLAGESEVALRWPSIAALALTLAFSVETVRRRGFPLLALAIGGAMVLLVLFFPRLIEARPLPFLGLLAVFSIFAISRVIQATYTVNRMGERQGEPLNHSLLARQTAVIAGYSVAALFAVGLLATLLPTSPISADIPADLPWRDAVADVVALREPLQPIVYNIPEQHPLAYYAPQMGLTAGLALNIGWRPFAEHELRDLATTFDDNALLWIVGPTNDLEVQTMLDMLGVEAGRGAAYSARIGDIVFVQLDSTSGTPPQTLTPDSAQP